MARFFRDVTRRFVLTSGLLGVVALHDPIPRRAQAAGRVRAYVCAGADTVSLLNRKDYRRIYENLFSGLDATFAFQPDRTHMLDGIVRADIVYMNVHSNYDVFRSAGGVRIFGGDVAALRRSRGRGPRLVVVSGCDTLKEDAPDRLSDFFGITTQTKGAAYIGFTTKIIGENADAYFRIFFGLWLRPRPDGSWRSLTEVRAEATGFMERMNALAADNARHGIDIAGDKMSFSGGVIQISRHVVIVGDGNLTFPALGGSATPDHADEPQSVPGRTDVPSPNGPTSPTVRPTRTTGEGAAPSSNAGGAPGSGDADAINRMLKQ